MHQVLSKDGILTSLKNVGDNVYGATHVRNLPYKGGAAVEGSRQISREINR